MGFLETGSELYFSIFKLSIVFTFFLLIANSIFNFVDLSFLPQLSFGSDMLNSAISTIQHAKGLDFTIAIPFLIVSVFGLMIEAFINGVLLLQWIINFFVNNILIIVGVSDSVAVTVGTIISWIVVLPAIIGLITDIGRMIFYMLFGLRR
jgi:hypothetical protein